MKLIDIIFKDLKKDKNIYYSLILAFIISFIFGLLFITILKDSDKDLLVKYITNYFENVKSSYKPDIANIIFKNIGLALIIWILGFSIIGVPILICILFYKGFSISFTITSLIYSFKIDGILISFIYIFPHLIINLFSYFILIYYSFKLSLEFIYVIFNKAKFNFKSLKKYLIILLITTSFILFSSLYETYILPYLIKMIY